eukprot:2346393-Rhodomonas_salina.1
MATRTAECNPRKRAERIEPEDGSILRDSPPNPNLLSTSTSGHQLVSARAARVGRSVEVDHDPVWMTARV